MIANIIRNAKKTVTGGDPYYSAVSLLLPMDGTNGSTTFTDSGPNALAVTAVGNAQISTTQSKYGGASAYFGGSTDRITAVTTNSTFTGDFTWECWFYPTSDTNTYKALFSAGSETAGRYVLLQYGSNIVVDLYGVGQNINVSCGITANSGWHHVALVRSGTTVTLYYDGVSKATATRSGTVGNTNGFFCGNNSAGTNPYNGYIDDLRVTKYARYTSAFTPPTQALPNIYNPYTTLPVSGAALWLDASQQNTIFSDAGTTPVTTSGQSIYQWNDLSGNNRHAVQATSGNRPTWVPPASGQNGLGAVGFNGSNQLISTATSGLSAQPFEYYIVFKFKSTTTNDRIVFGTGDRGNFDGNSGGGWNLFSGALLAGGTRTGTSWAMVNCKFNGSSSALRINASQVLSGNTGTGYPTAFSLAGNGSSDWGDITVAEFVVYSSTLSTGDQNLVESYLKTKWGTP